MNNLRKSSVLALGVALLAALVFTGCNTMKGLGKDTERAGEKIQEKANR